MAYVPTVWTEKITTLGPTNLNHLENGLQAAAAVADAAVPAPTSKVTNGAVVWNGSAWVDALLVNANIDPAAAIAYPKLNLAASVKASDMATSLADAPHGLTLASASFTASVSITATTEATANSIVSAGAFTFDGATEVCIEFFSPQTAVGTSQLDIMLYDGSASIGFFGFRSGAAGTNSPQLLRRYLTPSNASHTYSVRAFVDGGTGSVNGGAGGLGLLVPGYIRITKA